MAVISIKGVIQRAVKGKIHHSNKFYCTWFVTKSETNVLEKDMLGGN